MGVGSLDACPWLREGSSGVPDFVGDGDDVGAIISVENLSADHVVLNETTWDRVAVRRADPVDVNVGLYRETLPRRIGIDKIGADIDDGDAHLVSKASRFGREIAPIELGVVAALFDELHIGEAEADRIDTNEELVVCRLGDVHRLGTAFAPNTLNTLAVGVPPKIRLWERGLTANEVDVVPSRVRHGTP